MRPDDHHQYLSDELEASPDPAHLLAIRHAVYALDIPRLQRRDVGATAGLCYLCAPLENVFDVLQVQGLHIRELSVTVSVPGIWLLHSERQCFIIPLLSLAGGSLIGSRLDVLGYIVMSSPNEVLKLLLLVRSLDAGLPIDTFLGLHPRPGR